MLLCEESVQHRTLLLVAILSAKAVVKPTLVSSPGDPHATYALVPQASIADSKEETLKMSYDSGIRRRHILPNLVYFRQDRPKALYICHSIQP